LKYYFAVVYLNRVGERGSHDVRRIAKIATLFWSTNLKNKIIEFLICRYGMFIVKLIVSTSETDPF
jgi:hypothetical protein